MQSNQLCCWKSCGFHFTGENSTSVSQYFIKFQLAGDTLQNGEMCSGDFVWSSFQTLGRNSDGVFFFHVFSLVTFIKALVYTALAQTFQWFTSGGFS